MSELRTPHEEFADTLTSAISPEWEEFAELAANPSVQNFCQYDSRYSNMTRRTITPEEMEADYDLTFMKRNKQQVEEAPADYVAECLERTNIRIDQFMRTVAAEFCGRRNKPMPEDEAGQIMILNKIFSGGMERVRDSIKRVQDSGTEEASYYYLQSSFLPVSFVMIGARLKAAKHYENVTRGVEASSTQAEIDNDIDTALQEACVAIQQNKKTTVGKNASDADKLFASSMNCLRSFYHGQNDKAFERQVITYYGTTFFSRSLTEEDKFSLEIGDTKKTRALHAQAYRETARHFKELLGAELPVLDEYDAALAVHKGIRRGYENSIGGTNDFEMIDTEARISAIHSAHQFVDGIASGELKYSDIMKAMMKLREQPLEPTYYDKLVDLVEDEWVEWEILPAGLQEDRERNPSADGLQRAPIDHEEWVDWKRVWRLQKYAQGWSGAYMVRTKIPNLPLQDQYYAVVLPEVRDGELQEHAFADHPKADHGLYVWRAEMGQDNGRTRLTWREVMSQRRMVARQLGARCLYHVEGLEDRLLEYTTASPDKIARRHYARSRITG